MGYEQGLQLRSQSLSTALVEVAGVAEVFGGKIVVAGAVEVFEVDVE